jgi:hypothetical protein
MRSRSREAVKERAASWSGREAGQPPAVERANAAGGGVEDGR